LTGVKARAQFSRQHPSAQDGVDAMLHLISANFLVIAGAIAGLFMLVLAGASIEDAVKRP
jgi:hypothetical protein